MSELHGGVEYMPALCRNSKGRQQKGFYDLDFTLSTERMHIVVGNSVCFNGQVMILLSASVASAEVLLRFRGKYNNCILEAW